MRLRLANCRSPRLGGVGNMVNCGAAMYAAPVGIVNAGDPRGRLSRGDRGLRRPPDQLRAGGRRGDGRLRRRGAQPGRDGRFGRRDRPRARQRRHPERDRRRRRAGARSGRLAGGDPSRCARRSGPSTARPTTSTTGATAATTGTPAAPAPSRSCRSPSASWSSPAATFESRSSAPPTTAATTTRSPAWPAPSPAPCTARRRSGRPGSTAIDAANRIDLGPLAAIWRSWRCGCRQRRPAQSARWTQSVRLGALSARRHRRCAIQRITEPCHGRSGRPSTDSSAEAIGAVTIPAGLRRARLRRRARQADRRLPRPARRGLDLRADRRRVRRGRPLRPRAATARRWSSPTTTSPAPSPSSAPWRTTATARDLTPQQIGQTWLNYTIERRTIFWWGGLGNSTEHTAYLRLKNGIPAPESGSIAAQRQGRRRADRRPDLHRRLGDGRPGRPGARRRPRPPGRQRQPRRRGDLRRPGDRGDGGAGLRRARPRTSCSTPRLGFIPRDSIIARLIDDVREWHAGGTGLAQDPRADRRQLRLRHVRRQLPHGAEPRPDHPRAALRRRRLPAQSLMIVNTCGWDTDCNSGNVGCLLGHQERSGRVRRRLRLARSGRRPALPPDRRRRPRHHRRRHRDRTTSSTPAALLPGSNRSRRRTAPASTSRCPARSRASARRRRRRSRAHRSQGPDGGPAELAITL